MKIEDVNGDVVEVSTYYRNAKRVVVTINPGQSGECSVVLDAPSARALLKELADAL